MHRTPFPATWGPSLARARPNWCGSTEISREQQRGGARCGGKWLWQCAVADMRHLAGHRIRLPRSASAGLDSKWNVRGEPCRLLYRRPPDYAEDPDSDRFSGATLLATADSAPNLPARKNFQDPLSGGCRHMRPACRTGSNIFSYDLLDATACAPYCQGIELDLCRSIHQ